MGFETDFLILGHGYTADFLWARLKKEFPHSTQSSTSRTNAKRILFELSKPKTWANLPQARSTFWTFPPSPLDQVMEFFKQKQESLGHLVVVGSTSGFLCEEEGQRIHEDSPLDLSKERSQGEAFLKNQGATLVMSSGIYGPGRNPLSWVQKGAVGKTDQFINMIHVKDLSHILIQASQRGKKSELYIASDNCPLTWRSVIQFWENQNLVHQVPEKRSSRRSKKLDSSKTLKTLEVTLEFQNFPQVVAQGL